MPVVDVVTIVLAGIGGWFLLAVAIAAAWAFVAHRVRRRAATRSSPRRRAHARTPRPRTQEDL